MVGQTTFFPPGLAPERVSNDGLHVKRAMSPVRTTSPPF